MENRIKFLQEKIGKIGKNMQSQIDLLETEERVKTEEETRNWDTWKEEKRSFEKELADLLEIENGKAAAALAKQEQERALLGAKKDAKVVVVENKEESQEAMYAHSEELLRGIVSQEPERIIEAQKNLIEGGHYGEEARKNMHERSGFTTMKDAKGGVFLPTVIASKVFDMEQEYGVIPKYCENFGISESRQKIPSIMSRPAFYAVVEKAAIPGTGMKLGGMMLDPNKWACIADWTNEVGREAGNKLLPILNKKIAEASAYLKDNVVFNGDGTSVYHNKKGLITLASDSDVSYVAKSSAASGRTSFGALKAEDWLSLKTSVSPSVRNRGIYVAHPDLEDELMKLKDDQGQYIYGGPANAQSASTLWKRPLVFSEAFPVNDTADAPYAGYFDPSFLAYGTGTNMTATRLTEATITDEDGKSVNLATQDSSALRFVQSFDFQTSDVTTTTNGTAKGAFSVGYTAAS